MSDVQIIGLPQSNFVWSARIALAEKGVDHVNIAAAPHSAEVLTHNPFGRIPILLHGPVVVTESRAIIDYVDRAFEGPRLVPAGGAALTACDMWTSLIATVVEPLIVRQFVLAYLFPAGADGRPDQAMIASLTPKVLATLDLLEKALAAGAIGSGFDRTDTYLLPVLFYLSTTPEGGPAIAERPRLKAYLDGGLTRPSVRSTMPPPVESAR